MVLFVFNSVMISLRFYWFPRTFKASFLHPTESLFIPAAVISFGTILINISQYGVGKTGHWLEPTMCILYWCDCGLAIIFSIAIYLIMYVPVRPRIPIFRPVFLNVPHTRSTICAGSAYSFFLPIKTHTP